MSVLTIDDPQFVKKETYSAIDKFFLRYINDERDLVFVHLIIKLFAFAIPFTLYFFLAESISLWVAAAYLLINWVFLMGPFILMLHCTSHRQLFRSKHTYLNKIIPWLLGPFFGESPETYFVHHVGMHHPENNMDNDLSSTMHYQRDSVLDFTKYFLRFFFLYAPDLRRYFVKKKRLKLFRRGAIGEVSYLLAIIILSVINIKAALIVFIIPMCFTRLMMMCGNWAQHAFIDPNDPSNCYKNSITCINARYNKQCFNDGYHIVHHNAPTMHYTDMPGEFLANQDTYGKEKSIVFEGLDFTMIWVLLMTKNYKYLAKKLVRLDDSYPSGPASIEFLKARVAKI